MGGKLQTIVLWFERKISLHSKNRGVCSGGGKCVEWFIRTFTVLHYVFLFALCTMQ